MLFMYRFSPDLGRLDERVQCNQLFKKYTLFTNVFFSEQK